MKSVKWMALGLLLAALVAGCKGFWDSPTLTSSNPTTPTTLSSGVFYVLNQTTKQIAGYAISSGTLGAISGTVTIRGALFDRCRV